MARPTDQRTTRRAVVVAAAASAAGAVALAGPDAALATDTLDGQTVDLTGIRPGSGLWLGPLGSGTAQLVPIPVAVFIQAAKNGSQDIAPLIQDAYDHGARSFHLEGDGTYAWNTPVFLDSTAQGPKQRVVFHLHGAKVKLGRSLPRSSDFTPDTARRWALFPNTARPSSWMPGTNPGSPVVLGTPVNGPDMIAPPHVIVRDGTIDGQHVNGSDTSQYNNVGFCLGNNASARWEGVTAWRLQTVSSWINYCDMNAVEGCVASNPPEGNPTAATFLHQFWPGDGVSVHCEGEATGYLAVLVHNQGAHFRGPIGGNIKLTACAAVAIDAAHIEGDQKSATRADSPIRVDRSQVTVTSSVLWSPEDVTTPSLVIEDATATDAEGHSDVVLRDVRFETVYRSTPADPKQGPDIHIAAANASTRVRCDGVSGTMLVSGDANARRWRTGPLVTSAVPAIQAALDDGRAIVATGSWELHQRSGTWEVVPLGRSGVLRESRRAAAPTIALGNATEVAGSLTTQTYQYVAALLDAFGNYGPLSAMPTIGVTASGAVRITGSVPSAPARLVLWRRTGSSDVRNTPDHYVVLPVDGVSLRLFDTGAFINKRPWLTGAIPVPSTVAGSDHTQDGLALVGASGSARLVLESDRRLSTDALLSAAAGLATVDLGDVGGASSSAIDGLSAFGGVAPVDGTLATGVDGTTPILLMRRAGHWHKSAAFTQIP